METEYGKLTWLISCTRTFMLKETKSAQASSLRKDMLRSIYEFQNHFGVREIYSGLLTITINCRKTHRYQILTSHKVKLCLESSMAMEAEKLLAIQNDTLKTDLKP